MKQPARVVAVARQTAVDFDQSKDDTMSENPAIEPAKTAEGTRLAEALTEEPPGSYGGRI